MTFTLDVQQKTRGFLKSYLESLTLEDLNTIPKGFNNNIIWNIGHIIVTEQLLVYKLSGLPMLVSDELIGKYMKGTKPDGQATQEDVNELKDLLFSTIQRTKTDYNEGKFVNFQDYTLSTTGNTLTNVEEAINFNLFHEGIHFGYIMALVKVLKQ
ncbi:MAG: DinB family protein [Flavobacteriaceae bacterium]